MKILVIGSGGREHALIRTFSRCDPTLSLYAYPGSDAIFRTARRVTGLQNGSWTELAQFARQEEIDLTVCGPEGPLAEGVADCFRQLGLAFLGPSQAAAQLESSKAFCKEFMARHNVPTAAFRIFDRFREASQFLSRPSFRYPLVLKADGLAAGKGVAVCADEGSAQIFLSKIMVERAFGSSGGRVVIEECLKGEELSCIALCDGEDFLMLPPAQDHKRLFDGDLGPNTGGMGAYSWDGVFSQELYRQVEDKILRPTLRGMIEEGNRFNGFLYAGLMITAKGPMVLEYNVRLGDPETQPILMRLQGPVIETFVRAATGRLGGTKLGWDPRPAICVVLAAEGYPEKPVKGDLIGGLESITESAELQIFHAGTRLASQGWETAGGRVLGVTALGKTLHAACRQTYQTIDRIGFRGMQYRKDIAGRGLAREK